MGRASAPAHHLGSGSAPPSAGLPPRRAHAQSPPTGPRRPSSPAHSAPYQPRPPPSQPLPVPAITQKGHKGWASAPPMCQVEFEMACAAIKQLKGPVSDQEKLLVYSFYKQATQGDCNIPAPPATDVKAKAKWEAWNQNKGMSKMDAMRIYVAKVEELKKKDTG
ncbi:diazepam-binding inhibitor-like 5 isoform 1-T1 [Lycaon pictus]|nr:diazepam-binding inhibitor-like 5 isoform X1 [Canis lupus familiaris]XP_038533586.1 diazepam-binding inhibitor-like 5 isoform X1 [Canis lupus familiaris]